MASHKRVPTGLVIVFEGVDGVGKTTQLELARKALTEQGWLVHATRNLGGTPIGEELRQVAFSPVERSPETDLYISAAIQAELAKSIEAERAEGKIVLIDRGPLTFASYHIYGNKVDGRLGWQFADEGMARFSPELVMLYEMNLREALERAKHRAGHTDYYASKPKKYFEGVEHGYTVAAQRYKEVVTKLHAAQPIDTVHEQTMQYIQQALEKKLAKQA